jgi:HK97 family phage major capsid protein
MSTQMEEIHAMLDSQGKTINAFAEKQVKRIDALEDEIKGLVLKSGRPTVGGGGDDHAPPAERKALEQAVRALLAGDSEKANRFFVEAKAMSTGTGPEGGFVVHTMVSGQLSKVMAEISPLYSLARVIPLDQGFDSFEEPIDSEQAEAAWVGEQSSRPETDTPDLKLFYVPVHEIYAMPKATQKLIDTSSIDILSWFREKVGEAFGVKEGTSFHTGDGVACARGILTYDLDTASDASRAWGKVQYIATGTSGGFAAASTSVSPADKLIDMTIALRKQYRKGASWLMNSNTAGVVRKFKDAEGRFIWTDALVAGQPPTLLGYAVEIDEDMPDISADSLSVAFGNWKRAYTIVEKPGIRFLPDPYSAKPHVLLYSYRRVGGGVNNTQAYKLLKFSAS